MACITTAYYGVTNGFLRPESVQVAQQAIHAIGLGVHKHKNPTVGAQIDQSRSYVCTLGPKVGSSYILGALGQQTT